MIRSGVIRLSSLAESLFRPLACGSVQIQVPSGCNSFHTCSILEGKRGGVNEPKNWPKYNEIVYPPREAGEPHRPAEITHFRSNVKYSTRKLWYIAAMIRGLTIDEALKQLSFHQRKGSQIVKETLLEAQEMAVREHNVEYKSNLWIADSHSGKSMIIKGVRKHGRMRYGTIQYRYSHYFVRLREGKPPKHYFEREPTGNEKMQDYIQGLRQRTISHAL